MTLVVGSSGETVASFTHVGPCTGNICEPYFLLVIIYIMRLTKLYVPFVESRLSVTQYEKETADCCSAVWR